MFYAKLQSDTYGSIWLELPYGSFEQGKAFAEGVEFGSGGRFKIVDTRLSRHKDEDTLTKTAFFKLIQQLEEK